MMIIFSFLLKTCKNSTSITKKIHQKASVVGAEIFRGAQLRLYKTVKSVIPPLTFDAHKGQAGRVAVIGGCKDYTGAPYFAAITALKVGADLSHVFCTEGAGPVIKSYSPELIVHATLDRPEALEDFDYWLPRFHSLVIGPGLGREQHLLDIVRIMITKAKQRRIPLILDADAVFLVSQKPDVIRGYRSAILTPNKVEFELLYRSVTREEPDPDTEVNNVVQLSKQLGNVTIVLKGHQDIISNGKHAVRCEELIGSPRRCGGQGDLMAGAMGVFAHWAHQTVHQNDGEAVMDAELKVLGPNMCAAYGGCFMTAGCAELAFKLHGRQMTTTDMIERIKDVYDSLANNINI